jgi:hypothetical protein
VNLSSSHIGRIFKKRAYESRMDPEIIKGISSHSARVGAAQDLKLSGVSLPIIMNRGRWSKTDTLMRYIENTKYV